LLEKMEMTSRTKNALANIQKKAMKKLQKSYASGSKKAASFNLAKQPFTYTSARPSVNTKMKQALSRDSPAKKLAPYVSTYAPVVQKFVPEPEPQETYASSKLGPYASGKAAYASGKAAYTSGKAAYASGKAAYASGKAAYSSAKKTAYSSTKPAYSSAKKTAYVSSAVPNIQKHALEMKKQNKAYTSAKVKRPTLPKGSRMSFVMKQLAKEDAINRKAKLAAKNEELALTKQAYIKAAKKVKEKAADMAKFESAVFTAKTPEQAAKFQAELAEAKAEARSAEMKEVEHRGTVNIEDRSVQRAEAKAVQAEKKLAIQEQAYTAALIRPGRGSGSGSGSGKLAKTKQGGAGSASLQLKRNTTASIKPSKTVPKVSPSKNNTLLRPAAPEVNASRPSDTTELPLPATPEVNTSAPITFNKTSVQNSTCDDACEAEKKVKQDQEAVKKIAALPKPNTTNVTVPMNITKPPPSKPTPQKPLISNKAAQDLIKKFAIRAPNTKIDRSCENNPKWESICTHLSEHCATSLVTRMKCKKTCGSCKEVFPIAEPSDAIDRTASKQKADAASAKSKADEAAAAAKLAEKSKQSKLAAEKKAEDADILKKEKAVAEAQKAVKGEDGPPKAQVTTLGEDSSDVTGYMRSMSDVYDEYFGPNGASLD